MAARLRLRLGLVELIQFRDMRVTCDIVDVKVGAIEP